VLYYYGICLFLFTNFINLHRRSKLLRLSDRLWTLVKIEWGPNPRIFGTKFDERRDCTLRRMSLNFLKLECKQTHYRKVKGEDGSLFKSHGACIVHPLSSLKCSTCRRTSRSSMLAARKVWKVIKSTSINIALALEEFKYWRKKREYTATTLVIFLLTWNIIVWLITAIRNKY